VSRALPIVEPAAAGEGQESSAIEPRQAEETMAESPAPPPPPLTPRDCGGCTFCCKIMRVQDAPAPPAVKPGGKWCASCEVGKGCRTYETRPKACREFSCLWRLGVGTEAMRPDRSRVILTGTPRTAAGLFLVAHLDERETEGREWTGDMGRYLKAVAAKGVHVFIGRGPHHRTLHSTNPGPARRVLKEMGWLSAATMRGEESEG
jgi:hypothetical protein